jgi:hypothetical protein
MLGVDGDGEHGLRRSLEQEIVDRGLYFRFPVHWGCRGAADCHRLYLVGVQYITFSPAVMITTLVSGFGAGVFSVVLSAAAASVLYTTAAPVFLRSTPGGSPRSHLVTLSNVILISGKRSALVALRESQDRLGSVVAELQHRTRNLISVWAR